MSVCGPSRRLYRLPQSTSRSRSAEVVLHPNISLEGRGNRPSVKRVGTRWEIAATSLPVITARTPNTGRANVFRSAPISGHRRATSVLPDRANFGREQMQQQHRDYSITSSARASSMNRMATPHRDTIPGDTRRIPETPPLSSFLFGSGGVFVLVINAGVGPSICPYPLRREN
jgi:hypothetical protein